MRPKASAAIRKLIATELGFRYRPMGSGPNVEAHARRVELLADDVGDIPEHVLRAAIVRWCRENRFMPSASELIELARTTSLVPATADEGLRRLQEHCDMLNRKDCWGGKRWVVVGEYPDRTIDLRAA